MLYGIQLVTKEDEPTLTRPSIAITDGHAAISPAQMAIPRLYVTAFSRRFLRLAVRLLPLVGQDPRKFGRNKDIDLVQITSWFVPITAQLNVKPYIPYKERASACHLSQRPPTQQGSFITRLAFRRAQHLETFSRLYPPLKRSERMETDLFGA